MEKIKELIKKVCTKEVILYFVFGGLTTLINIGAFALFHKVFHWEENISNILAIMLAVIAAYLTNKDLVFHSEASNLKEKIIEFFKFMLGRAFTIVLEFVGGFLMFKLPIPEIISKLFVTVVVVILNFFISKYFAFSRKKDKKENIKE